MKKYITPTLLFISFLIILLLNIIPNELECDNCSILKKNDYTLKTHNINKNNKWATFRDETNGIFYISPGTKLATKGVFTFKKNANLILTFSIRTGSKYGNIQFTLKKNYQEIDTFIIAPKKKNQIVINVYKGDTLSIIADIPENAGYDSGNLKIENQYNLKQYTLSKIYNNIIQHKNEITIILLLSIIILLYMEFKTHPILQKFEESSLFIKVFQIVLFIWIFSIPLKNSLYQITTALIIILFLAHFFYYKQKNILVEILLTYKKLFIVFLLFIISMILSSLLGISEKGSLTDIFKYVFRYLFVLLILFYFYKQKFFSKQSLVTIIFIVLLIHALDAVYQYITGADFILKKLTSQHTYKLTGAVYHHNPFGLLMSIGSIMSLVLFLDKNTYTIFKYDKIVYSISLIIFLFTLFHSQSRSAWVMFGIFSIGYMFLYIKKNGIDKKLLYTIASLLILSTLFFLMDGNLSHRLTLLIQGNSAGRTSLIWPFTIDKIMNSPIFGYGINSYKLLATGTPSFSHAGVHNLSLELFLYTGIVGFSIFTYLIFLTLKESFTKEKILYFILFLSFIILMQFDGSLIDSKVHLNIFILILFFIYSFRLDKNTPDLVK